MACALRDVGDMDVVDNGSQKLTIPESTLHLSSEHGPSAQRADAGESPYSTPLVCWISAARLKRLSGRPEHGTQAIRDMRNANFKRSRGRIQHLRTRGPIPMTPTIAAVMPRTASSGFGRESTKAFATAAGMLARAAVLTANA